MSVGERSKGQQARLAELVAFARARSPFYRDLYADLPELVEDPGWLPAVTKAELMESLDSVVTDPRVTSERAREFVADPETVGRRLLGRYPVVESSGTTGKPAIILLDEGVLAASDSLRRRALRRWLDAADLMQILRRRGRAAMISATEGHFAGPAVIHRRRWRRRAVRIVSVYDPLSEQVAQLNRLRPVVMNGYATAIKLLADEQRGGRLGIEPVLVAVSAEGLTEAEQEEVATVFNAKVHGTYAAAECPFIAHSCAYRWLHVNSERVVLEPVDESDRPVPAGEESHSVLITNLANRIQPIIRYRLDDRVVCRPDPCPCGSGLPAIRIRGRTGDVLEFPARNGTVKLVGRALIGAVKGIPGVERFQVVQPRADTLRIRLSVASDADSDRVRTSFRSALQGLLARQGATRVVIEHDANPPSRTPGGKFRSVIPLAADSR